MASWLGTWTYRSFVNNPAPVNSAEEALALIFGEGLLTIVTADTASGFNATLSFGGNAVMDLAGDMATDEGGVTSAHAAGAGRAGSPISDYRYDYLFFEVPAWAAGIGQRQALVGSVVRAADHGAARKGATASTITVRQDS
ncbi:hypothetical protein ACQKKX_06400 [Neorhizobium sp. NPDC001467]|uniref:hypothetical protein n=1 Tax=Neorhizobium sp. NPDC001467 TaxID=3390595 RepID=UPI003D04BD9F